MKKYSIEEIKKYLNSLDDYYMNTALEFIDSPESGIDAVCNKKEKDNELIDPLPDWPKNEFIREGGMF